MATRPKDDAKTEGANGAASDGAPDAEQQAAAVDEDLHRYIAPVVGPEDERVFTDSGIEIKRLYEEDDVAPGLQERLGEPGDYPYTRGIHSGMYRDRLWTMRQYAGYATAEETNRRYRYLTEHGSTGLSMAFDLPTQLGRDSDDPLCAGEVGRTGVAIDTVEDMRICFDQISLAEVSTSMTINAPAAILLLLYELVGEEQGVPSKELRGTVQNDVLKEYISRGNYIYPPEPTMRLTTDIFAYCDQNVPKWNTISISGYHMREKGCSAVQEVAFTLANAIAYVEARDRRRPRSRQVRPAARLLLQRPQQRLPGDRQVPGGAADVGEDHAGALRRHRRAGADDPLPHPDRRGHPPGPAARGEHHPGRAAGVRRGRRRHPVAPHQRLRRGAGAADRALGADRPPHPAGARPRVRRRRHRRSVRRLLLHRVAHRRGRGARLGADEEGRGPRRLGERARVHPARGRGVGGLLPRALRLGPGHHRRRQQVRHRRGRRRRHPQGRSRVRAPPARAPREVQGQPRPGGRRPEARATCGRSPRATATCCRRSRRRSAPEARSARCAARCARSSASTGAGRSSSARAAAARDRRGS